MPDGDEWFAVRCVFRSPDADQAGVSAYEERITLWRAASFEVAIRRAEEEAAEYMDLFPDMARLDLCQAFKLASEGAPADGDEVFSLIRDSDLTPDEYLGRHFDTGAEYETTVDEGNEDRA